MLGIWNTSEIVALCRCFYNRRIRLRAMALHRLVEREALLAAMNTRMYRLYGAIEAK